MQNESEQARLARIHDQYDQLRCFPRPENTLRSWNSGYGGAYRRYDQAVYDKSPTYEQRQEELMQHQRDLTGPYAYRRKWRG